MAKTSKTNKPGKASKGPIAPPSGLSATDAATVAEGLQIVLAHFIDLSLQLKQVHWNLVGPNFRSLHLELDEIVVIAREASDEIAERMATLGVVSLGGAAEVAARSTLKPLPTDFIDVPSGLRHVDDRVQAVISTSREHLPTFGDLDPITEDLVIGVLGQLEKAGWMIKAQTAS